MNMLYRGVRKRGSTIIVPTDSMNLGSIAGFIPLARARNVAVPEASSETSPQLWPPPTVPMPYRKPWALLRVR